MLPGLLQAIKNGQRNHAYLFTGDLARTTAAAVELAQALNCTNLKADGPCGNCRSCRQIADGNHPDVSVLGTLDGKQKISIEQIRKTKQQVSLHSYQAGYQIVLLPEAEKFTLQAANSLLQILEEPPEATVFILTAAHADLLLPTILSRCQVFSLREPGGLAVQEEAEQEVVREAQDFIRSLPKTHPANLLQWSKNWDGKNKECLQFLQAMLFILRDMTLPDMVASDLALTGAVLPAIFDRSGAQMAAAKVAQTMQYLNQQVNSKLLLDVLVLDLAALARSKQRGVNQ